MHFSDTVATVYNNHISCLSNNRINSEKTNSLSTKNRNDEKRSFRDVCFASGKQLIIDIKNKRKIIALQMSKRQTREVVVFREFC